MRRSLSRSFRSTRLAVSVGLCRSQERSRLGRRFVGLRNTRGNSRSGQADSRVHFLRCGVVGQLVIGCGTRLRQNTVGVVHRNQVSRHLVRRKRIDNGIAVTGQAVLPCRVAVVPVIGYGKAPGVHRIDNGTVVERYGIMEVIFHPAVFIRDKGLVQPKRVRNEFVEFKHRLLPGRNLVVRSNLHLFQNRRLPRSHATRSSVPTRLCGFALAVNLRVAIDREGDVGNDAYVGVAVLINVVNHVQREQVRRRFDRRGIRSVGKSTDTLVYRVDHLLRVVLNQEVPGHVQRVVLRTRKVLNLVCVRERDTRNGNVLFQHVTGIPLTAINGLFAINIPLKAQFTFPVNVGTRTHNRRRPPNQVAIGNRLFSRGHVRHKVVFVRQVHQLPACKRHATDGTAAVHQHFNRNRKLNQGRVHHTVKLHHPVQRGQIDSP